MVRVLAKVQPNHLLSAPPVFLKLHFRNTADLYTVRRELLPLAQANSAKFTAVDAYADIVGAQKNGQAGMEPEEGTEEAWGAEDMGRKDREPAECIVDVREYDINYYLRVAIDLGKLHEAQRCRGNSLSSRCSSWAVVQHHLTPGHHLLQANHGSSQASRTSSHGVRYRDDETASQIPRSAN